MFGEMEIVTKGQEPKQTPLESSAEEMSLEDETM